MLFFEFRRLILLRRFIFKAFAGVNSELEKWKQIASNSPDYELKKQALASLTNKKFHCQGGSVFAIWAKNYQAELIKAIVALQTISDYLDNLCDRAGIFDEEAFRQLHKAFIDALTPEADISNDYYAKYPFYSDGGYLKSLVKTCQEVLRFLPSYKLVQGMVLRLGQYYCNLQATKHIEFENRQKRLKSWLKPLLSEIDNDLYWWELAAATGSTLGIFVLMALAAWEDLNEIEIKKVYEAYFPWIGGLHILLDYYIDQQEDKEGGDLNFVAYYNNDFEAGERLKLFLKKSLEKANNLIDPSFHLLIVQGLPALYFSDSKLASQYKVYAWKDVLLNAGPYSRNLYRLCKALRKIKII
ncbi:MAG: tetraprenyl-beta-curcumene synthase [Clostridia bacterium]|nr:tetraprenyl-beta-curcumene synthase [Clostridia bacterium]